MGSFVCYGTSKAFHPPSINEDVRNRLLEELGLDVDPGTRSVIQGITGELQPILSERMEDLAKTVFQDIAQVKPEFVRTVVEVQQDLPGKGYISNKNYFAIGMAVVARAFALATDYRLIDRMAVLDEEDLAGVKNIVSEIYTVTEGKTILEQALEAPRIPDHEINLRHCVDKAMGRGYYSKIYGQMGAVAMYRIVAQLWPKLFPPTS